MWDRTSVTGGARGQVSTHTELVMTDNEADVDADANADTDSDAETELQLCPIAAPPPPAGTDHIVGMLE